MMKPDPMPQPVLMNTVALRAVSIALRAGKVFASCASRPLSACADGPADDGACGAAPICAAPVAAGARAASGAGAMAHPRGDPDLRASSRRSSRCCERRGSHGAPAQEVPGECRAHYRGEGERTPTETGVRTLVARPAGAARDPRLLLGEFREIDPARCTFDRVSLLMSALRAVHALRLIRPSPAGRPGARSQFLPPPPRQVRPRHPDRPRAPFIMRASHGRTPSHEIPSRAPHRVCRLRVLRIEPPRPP